MPKDPAFLFYPGDASNDTQFMNRLEKGAYFDLVKSQRLFGGFTMVQLRKILGPDFEAVWPSLELVLDKDEDEKYYIPWVRQSLVQREEFSKKQAERIAKRWKNRGNTAVLPYIENGNVIEDETVNKTEKVKFKENVLLTQTEYTNLCTDYGTQTATEAIEYLHLYKQEKGYTTKSDYLTLKRWVVDAVSKLNTHKKHAPQQGLYGPIDYIIANDGTKIYQKDIDFSKLGKSSIFDSA